jgi:5S rRNA maturation endonuclease (ribonuclease M5)
MLSPNVLKFFEKLRKEEGLLIIVEGKKDKEVMASAGFEKILAISGKPVENVVEEIIKINPSEVAILTDFDEEGEHLSSFLSNILSHYKVNVNQFIRRKLKSFKINKIEELKSLTKLMEDGQNGKISPIFYKIFNRSRILSRRNSGKTRCYRCDIWSDRRIVGSRFRLEGTPENW